MYNYKKGDNVYLLKREINSDVFTGFVGIVKSKGNKGKTLTVYCLKDKELIFRDDKTCTNDIFANLFYLFSDEKEANRYLRKLENTQMMKEDIMRLVKSKCTFEELEQIYLFLEAHYPYEMR